MWRGVVEPRRDLHPLPWLDGLALHQVTRTVSETAERSVNAVLEMLAMFHQRCVLTRCIDSTNEKWSIDSGNVWFVMDDQLSVV